MRFDKMDRCIDHIMAQSYGPAGCAVAMAKDGEVLYTRYAGFADLEQGTPITEETVFDIWSLTKVIVCSAAMTLYEKGAFLLNDPIDLYFPEYKMMQVYERDNWAKLRLRPARTRMLVKDAFTMATGMPLGMMFDEDQAEHPAVAAMVKAKKKLEVETGGRYTLQQEIHAMAEVPLAFDPGTHWMYGYSHELVAGLIEVCSGMTVGEYLKKTFFEPMGLKSMGYRFQPGQREKMATFYNQKPDGTKEPRSGHHPNHEPDATFEGGGSGLMTTVEDFLAFTQMLANGGMYKGEQYIGRKTIDLMRQNQLNAVQLEDFYINAQNAVYMPGYGYGLGVRTMIDRAHGYANTSPGEFGWTGGSGTWAAIDPEEHFSVVYMHQMWPNNEAIIHPRVRAAAFGCLE